jgi:DNA-binding CsgD family transcriptional regulator
MTHDLYTEPTGPALQPAHKEAREHAALWDRASEAETQAVDSADRGSRERAIAHYREALACYDRIGSLRDSARVRLLLRDLGVRVRHWSYEQRPASGWASLTPTQRRITDLVALGLTNRQVGAEMFISVHTVAFHLRHIFRKLDIRSRVELARLAVERSLLGTAPAPATPFGSEDLR